VTDYGHELRFGSFITPTSSNPEQVVDLALVSETSGLDLVSFQDHPYQPALLDAWTLLTWVAARTTRIHVAGNVLNTPLRQPAVLARQAAALDLLSGGRLALGLGAGGFWDAIEAMGVPRLSAGESVEALGEAIDIIRGILDTDSRSLLRIEGKHHRVNGVKRGPALGRDIPIWVGAYKPRLLRLVGRQADGWLPSQSYLQPGDLMRGNKVIDEAAVAAGRRPDEVVRLLNVSPDQGVDELVELALDEGISTFIVVTDSATVIERFGREVAPSVREEVINGRASRGTTHRGRIRSARALSKRVSGIGYDEVPPSLGRTAVEPGDKGYSRYRSGYLRGGAPGLILRPQSVDEVADAVRFARGHRDVPLGIFSAGHGLSGRSLNTGGLVIDVGALNTIEILESDSGRVRIGPGARWLDVASALSPHHLAISSGDYGGVGVGGLATAGGIGWFAREHGLTIDHIRAVDLILADGSLVHTDASKNSDLFWAVRGAGANFGVAVSFEFEAAKVGRVGFAQFAFDASDTAAFLQSWGTAIENSDRSVSGEVILSLPRPANPTVAQAMIVVNSDDPDTILQRLTPIAQIAPLLDHAISLGTYDQVMAASYNPAPQQAVGEPSSHSGLLDHITPEFATDAAGLIAAGASFFFQIRSVGGAVADVDADTTAYGGRDANFAVAAFGTRATKLDQRWPTLLPHFTGMYLSFETDTGDEIVARAFPPQHLDRLRQLKRQYDPTGLFRDNFFIDPRPE
jgi:alkanesulfonate monooxygenase SsuD/methylene tetrahydromethanopterin reductase-like flavin-dependent oxidoreductase (luciferase family)/FAD/FMN-containing dehydrogenase